MHVPPSRRHPGGYVTTRRGHCAKNPTGRDQLYPDEIHEIAEQFFHSIKDKPCPLVLFPDAPDYDVLIAGWTQYWNDVFQPRDPLTPNLVKALIASESSFKADALANEKNGNSARGLTQITNATRKILGDEKGELRDYYITATKEDLNDPSINIAAGIRWLFHKRAIASGLLGREASWEEAVAEYKGARTVSRERTQELMSRFRGYMEKYEKCGKP